MITLKKTLIFSTTLMVLLNLWHFCSSYQQREAAFAPAWAATKAADASGPAPATAATTAAAQSQSGASATANSVAPAAPPSSAPAPSDAAVAAAQKLAAAGLKPDFAALYLRVQSTTGTPWQLLAAVHRVETGQSGDTSRASYAGAVGPMQFMPATFRAYAVDGNGDGAAQITSLDDAMMTAGHYLAAGGANRGNYTTALFNYNHSNAYVSKVLGIAHQLGL